MGDASWTDQNNIFEFLKMDTVCLYRDNEFWYLVEDGSMVFFNHVDIKVYSQAGGVGDTSDEYVQKLFSLLSEDPESVSHTVIPLNPECSITFRG